MKKFISGFIIGSLLFSFIGAIAVSYVANPVDFKIMVNGNEFTSDPPALEVDGKTYLPLRAIGDALGVPVNWNEELQQAEVGQTPDNDTVNPETDRVESEILTKSSDQYYKENAAVPNLGYALKTEPTKKEIKDDYSIYYYDLSGLQIDPLKAYETSLKGAGFSCSIKGNSVTAMSSNDLSIIMATRVNNTIFVIFTKQE